MHEFRLLDVGIDLWVLMHLGDGWLLPFGWADGWTKHYIQAF